MNGKQVARTLLVAAGVLVAGCGGTEVEQESSPAMTTREDGIICSDHSMYDRWIYYSDSTYTVAVGQRSCECYDVVSWGRTTEFYLNFSGSCE